jgi:alcohol dehydrogenase
VALGGGSVIDAAKAFSVTLTSELERPLDHVLRQDNSYTWKKHLPVIAIPTTAGTGSEVTPFSSIWDSTTHQKHSLYDDRLFPAHALLDPTLTFSLPRQETLYTSLDAVSHALESLWNKNRTPLSDSLAFQALKLSNSSLPIALKEPFNLNTRILLQQASLLAGMAISQTRTAIAHSISYPLTSYYHVPHGLACSFSLAEIWKLCRNSASEILLSDTVTNTINMLDSLDLASEISKFVCAANASALIDEMYVPERTDNFVLSIDSYSFDKILRLSLSI